MRESLKSTHGVAVIIEREHADSNELTGPVFLLTKPDWSVTL